MAKVWLDRSLLRCVRWPNSIHRIAHRGVSGIKKGQRLIALPFNAEGETRTLMGSPPRDFESRASAIPPLRPSSKYKGKAAYVPAPRNMPHQKTFTLI